MPSSLLERLNARQREAVTASSRSVLVTGAAGTGKTEVLARRLAWLAAQETIPLADALILSRSEAAGQMLSARIAPYAPEPSDVPSPWTLRAWSVRLLRRHGSTVGMPSPFSIYDPEDVLHVLERLMKQHGMRQSEIDLHRFRLALARAKDEVSGGAPAAERVWESDPERELYAAYEATLTRSLALDWSDVDRWTQRLLAERPELAEPLTTVIVDDAQELSSTQHAVLCHMLEAASHAVVAWSPDQRIAGQWTHPPDVIPDGLAHEDRTIRIDLSINQRSDELIARYASALRDGGSPGELASRRDERPPAGRSHGNGHNPEEEPVSGDEPALHEKPPPDADRGRPVIVEADSGEQEAEVLPVLIRRLMEEEHDAFGQIAVLSRTVDQAEQITRALEASDIPYRRHYAVPTAYEPLPQLMAYLRLTVNPRDRSALERVLNYPKRGIGPKTRQRLGQFARAEGVGWGEAMERIDEADHLSSRQRRAVRGFHDLIRRLAMARQTMAPKPFLEHLIEETGIAADTAKGRTHAALKRWERVLQAIEHIAAYAEEGRTPDGREEAGPACGLEAFIQDDAVSGLRLCAVGLSPMDAWRDTSANRVTVTTFAHAKDIACDVALVTGLEEGLSPLSGMESRATLLKNERRLLYVAVTRPRRRLFLLWARSRLIDGDDTPRKRSRFIDTLGAQNDQTLMATEILRRSGASYNEVNAYAQMNPHYYRTNLRAKQADARPDPKPVDEEINAISEGTDVSHPKFGTGSVVATEGKGERRVASIDFGPELGVKKLRLKHAKLEVIGHD